MSRGPGAWQRFVLAELGKGRPFYLTELLPERYTMSQYKALHRAAVRLANSGRVGYWRFLCGAGRGNQSKVVITRPGAWKPDRPE